MFLTELLYILGGVCVNDFIDKADEREYNFFIKCLFDKFFEVLTVKSKKSIYKLAKINYNWITILNHKEENG